jgi:hypothetical protein
MTAAIDGHRSGKGCEGLDRPGTLNDFLKSRTQSSGVGERDVRVARSCEAPSSLIPARRVQSLFGSFPHLAHCERTDRET